MRRPGLGDIVRIVSTPATVDAGYADRTGTCYGFTTPSITGVPVIGSPQGDNALAVGFGDGAETVWFDPSLVTFLDVNAGQTATIGSKSFVRMASGDWVEVRDSN